MATNIEKDAWPSLSFCKAHLEDDSWTQYGCPVCSAGKENLAYVNLQNQMQSLESQLKEAMKIGTAYCEHAKQTRDFTGKLVKALEGIKRRAYVQSSSFALVVYTYAQNALEEWDEHEEWKSLRDYQFCKHVEKEEEED